MFDCFIFDFDGTLAHSERAYLYSFQHSIKLHTGVTVSEEEFKRFWNLHRNISPEDVLRQFGEEMLEEMVVSFEEHYYANHYHHVELFDGISEMLEELRQRAASLGLVSLKPRRAGIIELGHLGLSDTIRAVVWGDDVEQ